uniref:Odorant binding protein 5 n=1 Tax=Nilaparvata lugens TaxID=108931 RepID=A0A220XIQ7_NILLU|nr:odorant binding protein 5 [Nilaparvata lugens]
MERTSVLIVFTFIPFLSSVLGANFLMMQQSMQGTQMPMIQSIASELKFCMDINAEQNSDGLNDYLPLLFNEELPSTLGQKCFLTCLFNRFGLLKDGFLDTKTAKNLVETFYADKHDEKTMANIAINVCHVAAVPDALNPCEIGFSLKSCFVDSNKKGKELRGKN